MADMTAQSTFGYTVKGNRRVVSVDVSTVGRTTSDTVSIPYLTAITNILECAYRTSVWDSIATTALVGPFASIGSSANTILLAQSSLAIGVPIRFTVEGR